MLAACQGGSSLGGETDPQTRSLALTGDAGPDVGAREPGVYLVSKHVLAEESDITQIDAAVALEPAELAAFDPGSSGVAVGGFELAVPYESSVFVADVLAPEIVRYDADENGALVEAGRVSFASAGLEFATGYNLTIASDTKAYLFDTAGLRAIAWDPSTLQITGELDLSAGAKEGLAFAVGARDARVGGGLLYVPAYWFSEEDFSSPATSAIVAIDLATDEASLAEDARCATYSLVALPSGGVIAFPDGFFAQQVYLDVPAPRAPTCALRIEAGERTYAEELIDLGALVGGDEFTGGAVQGGISDARGGIYIAVADEQRYFAGEANVYRLWRWDLASNLATPVSDTPLWNAYLSSYTTGDQVFAVLPGDEQTSVLELSHPPLAAFQLPGNVEVFARLAR